MRALRLGVAGLGRAFMLMLPTLVQHARVTLVAAADPRAAARARFERDFGARSYDTVAGLCADPAVDAVYVATPHQHHVAHVRLAAAAGKHVLVEKPMALSIEECQAMIAAAAAGGVHLLVGHSHSYDLPYLRTRALIETGAFGAVRMITALNFTDYLYRPRRPEELDTAQGGGALFSQAPHQVEVVRLLAGSRATRVRASAGAWDAARGTEGRGTEGRGTEGAYAAHLGFEDGAFATLTYSGYGRFDTDAWQGGFGEMGQRREGFVPGAARGRLRGLDPAEEAAAKDRRAYGSGPVDVAEHAPGHNHFGVVIVCCEGGDLRPLPDGIEILGDAGRRFEALPPPAVPRAEVIDELAGVVLDGVVPLHTGAWGMATMEVCLAMLQSSREGREIGLLHQVGPLQVGRA